ncbi:MAG: hypothetical protein DRJ57_06280 [Thermoprotei archaeon]|nr:MAG: hypothetical protein DRJ57_06280 [Thermoprotei archaeon]
MVVGDALNMPFKSCVFDAVESWFGIGNIVGFSKAVPQAYRVLRPGGSFAVSGAWGKAFFDSSVFGKVMESLTLEERGELIDFLRRMELMPRAEEVVSVFRCVGFRNIEVYEEEGLYVVAGRK